MKKLLILSLSLISLFSLISCGSSKIFKAGTYTGTSFGRNNNITVETTFSDNEIESIKVVSHHETAGIGTVAIDQMVDSIISKQSLGVEIVTGATLSSYGLIRAVEDCTVQAGAELKDLKTIADPEVLPEKIEKSADIIIVGSGGAGMSAALAASETGASVIVIETNGLIGGNTIVSGMCWNAADPEECAVTESNPGQFALLQSFLDMNEADVEDYAPTLTILKQQIREYLAGDTTYMFDSPELHIMQFWTGCRRQGLDGTWIKSEYELAREFSYTSLDGIKWLKGHGIKFKDGMETVFGGLWRRGHLFADKEATFYDMEDIILKMGSEILLNTHADDLIFEDGKVQGVTATYKGSVPVTLHAEKAVILASGGFSGNKELADKYNNYWPAGLASVGSDNIKSTSGDGIIMAMNIGADTEGMGYVQLFPAVNAVTMDMGSCSGTGASEAIYINKNGERFTNEYAERDVMSKAVLEQPGGSIFQIFDDSVMQHKLEIKRGPTIEDYENYLKIRALFKVDTLEEAAEVIGCDPETFKATVEAYNTAVDDSYDPQTGRTVFGQKFDTAPFYIAPAKPSIHNTMGGLKVNIENAVLNTEGTPIPGLYAAGEVTGGLHGGNRLGGNAVGDAFVTGRNAGMNAVR